MKLLLSALAFAFVTGVLQADSAAAQDPVRQRTPVPGEPKSPTTKTLEVGARVLQDNTPLDPFDVYLVGFHPMKERPELQMEAHHFCHQVNEDFAQCTLFDHGGRNARLNGIEYIISEKLFESLPKQERSYWHPHNGEILSGQLVAPGLPTVAEKPLMEAKMNSYGKTWHVWNTGFQGMKPDELPLGPAMLAWSFNRDGEAIPLLVEKRDRRMGISTPDKRQARADLRLLAKPQAGVDALKGEFKRPTREIPGVVDKASAAGAVR